MGGTQGRLPQNAASEDIVPPLNISIAAANETAPKNQEDITVLWVGIPPQSISETKLHEKIHEVNNSVRLYDNLKLSSDSEHSNAIVHCMKDSLEYVELMEKEKAVIILSYASPMTSDMVREYIGNVNQNRSVDSIFILDIEHKIDAPSYSSFAKVSYHENFEALFDEVVEQIERIARQLLAFSLFEQRQRTTKDLTKESASFLWFQVLVDALKKMPKNKNSFRSMLLMCRDYYGAKTKYSKDINEFEKDYKPSDAVKWYTRDTFLYRLLNKALRTEDVTSLYVFRTFIVDLCNQLEKEYEKLKSNENELTLYRGQQMSENEIEKLQHNKNNLISTNGFFSTTRSKDTATKFAQTSSTRTDLTPVLFQIQASTKLEKIVFADIGSLSEYAIEREVLFSIGAVFQIDKVDFDHTDKMYKVFMIATDEGSRNVAKLGNKTSATGERMLFGELLLDMGKYTESQKYFEKMREEVSADDIEIADIYHNEGRAYGYKGDFDKALANFNRAYEIRSRTVTTNDYALIDTLNSLGVIYGEKGEYDKAKKKFTDALSMLEKHSSTNEKTKKLHIAQSRSNIGWIHFLKGQYEEALEHHTLSLTERKKFVVVDDLLLADNYSSIGGVRHAIGEFDEAMKNYNEALKIRQLNLPTDHPSIASIYQSIGGVFHDYGRYDDALENYKQALDIRAKALGLNHSSMAIVYKSIGGVHLDRGDYDQALKQYMRALEICMMTVSENHPSTADCYHSLGMLCERRNRFEETKKFYTQARKLTVKFLPVEHPSAAKVWTSLANLQLRQSEYDKSIKIYEEVLKIQRVGSEEHPDIILTYNAFGVLYRLKTNYSKAQKYFEQALTMCEKYFAHDHPMKARILHNMGDMYADMKNFQEAVIHFKKAVSMREATLPPDDLSTASSYYNLGCAYYEIDNKVMTISCFEKTLGIYEKQRLIDQKAIEEVKKAIEIADRCLE